MLEWVYFEPHIEYGLCGWVSDTVESGVSFSSPKESPSQSTGTTKEPTLRNGVEAGNENKYGADSRPPIKETGRLHRARLGTTRSHLPSICEAQ